ncbi:hypothetical protein B2G71_10775 [Novosphingobium sp. PC22D]|uniref:protein phosphatase 2C domain-containing protein n=1 Tax=Novosphingobium sp. PC22D TaxID=1962403 RepID=UPI000BFAC5FD|nr:protein phosphatase 2C domain-containing protein [Novosphingobium sp. PC22D]PEQ12845.1 hypothetical protein B2G71_10775 [Novosphingobium sp. PC22D]
MHFELVQSISLAGSFEVANDDRAGMTARAAWIIDGATDLGEPGLVGASGGAEWLSCVADRAFATCDDLPVDAMCRAAAAEAVAAYERDRTREPVARWELPRAALFAARLHAERLEFAWIADCCAYLVDARGAVRLGPPADIGDGEERTAAALAEHGLGAAKRPGPILEFLREARSQAGPDGFGVENAGLAKLQTGSVACAAGASLVLMTDGFSALLDRYDLVTPDELGRRLAADGLDGLVREMRAAEARDARCERWPRFKVSDDATALWLRIA